jgi:hypothetical protein
MKKILIAIAGIVFLLIVFLTTEENKDFLTEETYWKKNISEIRYTPPQSDWSGIKGQEFLAQAFSLIRLNKGNVKSPPIFIIKSQGINGEELVYEAGYNVKNLFTELSVLKIKSVVEAKPSYMEEYSIDLEKSPRLDILDGKKSLTLHLGIEIPDKSLFSFSDGKFILSTFAHSFRRFKTKIEFFRERNLVSTGNGYITKIRLKTSKELLEIENSPEEDKLGVNKNVWRRNTGTRLVFPPELGDELDSLLKSLRYELFPDDGGYEGVAIIKELTMMPIEMEWEVWTSEGRIYKIMLFPRTNLGDKDYRPTIRTIEGNLEESPAYTSEEMVQRLIQTSDKIRKSEKWQRPEKKLK